MELESYWNTLLQCTYAVRDPQQTISRSCERRRQHLRCRRFPFRDEAREQPGKLGNVQGVEHTAEKRQSHRHPQRQLPSAYQPCVKKGVQLRACVGQSVQVGVRTHRSVRSSPARPHTCGLPRYARPPEGAVSRLICGRQSGRHGRGWGPDPCLGLHGHGGVTRGKGGGSYGVQWVLVDHSLDLQAPTG